MTTCEHCGQKVPASLRRKQERQQWHERQKEDAQILASLKRNRAPWMWADELPYANQRSDLIVWRYNGKRKPMILRGHRKQRGVGQSSHAWHFMMRAIRMFKLTILDSDSWRANAIAQRIEARACERWSYRAIRDFHEHGVVFIGGERKRISSEQRRALAPFAKLHNESFNP